MINGYGVIIVYLQMIYKWTIRVAVPYDYKIDWLLNHGSINYNKDNEHLQNYYILH